MNSSATIGYVSFVYEKKWLITGFFDRWGIFYPMYAKKCGDRCE